MKANTIVMLFIFTVSNLFAQSVSQQWVTRYNGTGNSLDYSYALTLDNAGSLLVTGFATNTGTSKDMTTIKYDPSGNIMWSRSYDGAVHGGDYSFAVVTDASGNVYVTGRSDSGPTSADITTIKYDAAGNQQWASLYDGPAHGFDEARSIAVDNIGNVFVGGRNLTVSNDQDMVIIKYNSAGVQQWAQTYNGPGNGYDAVNSLALDQAGNIYVSGESLGSNTGADYITIKYDNSGAQQWLKRYNGPGNGGDVANAVKLDGSGNVYVTGFSDGGATLYDFATIKYDPAGTLLWERRYNANSSDFATAMAVTTSGNVYVTGTTTTANNEVDSNYATLKYNTNGDLLWAATYHGPNNASDVPRGLILDAQENVYITGSSFIAPDLDDYATIKYNSDGAQQWVMTYNGPANSNDYASSIAVNSAGDVFVTGRSNGGLVTSFDYATIKYSRPTGITPVSNQVPLGFMLYQNYPNPFNPETKIKFDIPEASEISIDLFNLAGKVVSGIYKGFVNPGSYEISFDASNLSSGVYFYRINAGKFIDTKKMMLIK